ncbi:MAG: ATP-binding protein [Candidatus Saganbacteria bacterium]|nr:ATP-binding protein [Candidatus Saganbacteria bacterium]
MIDLPVQFYSFSALFNGLTSAFLAFVLISSKAKSTANKTFLLFLLIVVEWSLLYFLWLISAGNIVIAEIFARSCMIGVLLMPALFLHFINSLLKTEIKKTLLISNYLLSFIFISFVYSPLYINGPRHLFVFPYWPIPGPLFHLAVVHFLSVYLYSHYLMWTAIKKSRGILRNQIFYVFTGTLMGGLAGATNFLTWYAVIPPYLNILTSIYTITITYAIVQYRLMDIEIIIKKGIVYSSVTAILTGLLVSAILIGENLSRGIAGYSSVWVSIPTVFILALIFQPLRDKIQGFVDRRFFVARYDYQRMLNRYSHALREPATDLSRFARLSPYLISKAMKLSGASLLVLDRAHKRYEVRAGIRKAEAIERMAISDNYAIIREMQRTRKIIVREEIEYDLNNQALPEEERKKLTEIRDEMQKLMAHISIPSISESEYFREPVLLSVLNLGEKLSGDSFSPEDISFLETMANQATITIEYAFIMEELKKNQARLIQSEKLAALGTMAAGVVSELNKPLETMEADAREMTHKFGDPAFREKFFTEIPREIMRLDKVVNDLLAFARTTKLNIQSVKLDDIIEKVLSLVNVSIVKNNIEVLKDIKKLPELNGDPEKLMSAVTNILTVCIKSMPSGGKLILKSSAGENNALIDIEDTGPGIPEEKLKEIFVSFYAPAEGQGGLELALANKVIRDHGGSIAIESQLNKGTKFHVSLPL